MKWTLSRRLIVLKKKKLSSIVERTNDNKCMAFHLNAAILHKTLDKTTIENPFNPKVVFFSNARKQRIAKNCMKIKRCTLMESSRMECHCELSIWRAYFQIRRKSHFLFNIYSSQSEQMIISDSLSAVCRQFISFEISLEINKTKAKNESVHISCVSVCGKRCFFYCVCAPFILAICQRINKILLEVKWSITVGVRFIWQLLMRALSAMCTIKTALAWHNFGANVSIGLSKRVFSMNSRPYLHTLKPNNKHIIAVFFFIQFTAATSYRHLLKKSTQPCTHYGFS